jgi:hypothetical protein
MKFKLFAFMFCMATFGLNAQNETIADEVTNDCACCSEKYGQFDFWEGEWMVFDTLGTAIGSNSIIKLQDNCVMQENWRSMTSTGTSFNYFDKKDGLWHQNWIDNSGGTLNLSGILVGKNMVLRSELLSGQNGNVYHRIKWSPQENGDVIQLWEIVNEENVSQKVLFKGIYKKNFE